MAKGDTPIAERFFVRELVESIQAETGTDLFVEMLENIREVTAAVLATGKGGSVSLTVKIGAVRFKEKDGWATGKVLASAEVKMKKPTTYEPLTVVKPFFVTEDGALTVEDPMQPPLLGGRS